MWVRSPSPRTGLRHSGVQVREDLDLQQQEEEQGRAPSAAPSSSGASRRSVFNMPTPSPAPAGLELVLTGVKENRYRTPEADPSPVLTRLGSVASPSPASAAASVAKSTDSLMILEDVLR